MKNKISKSSSCIINGRSLRESKQCLYIVRMEVIQDVLCCSSLDAFKCSNIPQNLGSPNLRAIG